MEGAQVKVMDSGESLQKAAWRKLKKNFGAMFGIVVISIALLAAILSYFIAPDPSPYANHMIVEIGGRNPGFSQRFLLLKKKPVPEQANFFQRLAVGREEVYQSIPILGYTKK